MNSFWTVLGGWALSPSILSDIFGDSSKYIDINRHISPVIKNTELIPDWKDHFLDLISRDFKRPFYLAGWSTGAIIAAALAPIIKPDALVLFSPTRSFCRRQSFSYGMRPSILHTMINALESDKETVLQQFFSNCGADQFSREEDYSIEELQKGLFFLSQVHLFEHLRINCPIFCFHGTEDKIIPVDAGRDFCKQIGGSMNEFSGSHSFFQKAKNEILNILSKYL